MKLAGLAPFVLAVSTLAPEEGNPLPPDGRLPLPAPSGPLTFDPGTTEIGLDKLVLRLAALTGQELAMTQQTRQMLGQILEPLESAEPVPQDEVYSFVEGLLARQGVLIAPITGGTRPILGIHVPDPRSATLDPLYVEFGSLGELAAHPALYVRVLLNFKNTDGRQLQTQLRQLLIDNTGTNQCVPAGDIGLILQGRGREIAALASLLLEADKAAANRPPVVVPKAEGPK